MSNAPHIGQRIRIYNTNHYGIIVKIHPFGTVDVRDEQGRYFRITGLAF